MEIKVIKRFVKISPDKIRPLVNLIRGFNAQKAIYQLQFTNKSAAKTVLELIRSGMAAAKDKDMEADELFIKTIYSDEGPRLKRRRIIHRGRATAINKRMSHIALVLSDKKTKEAKKISKNIKKDIEDTKDVSGGKNGTKSKSK